MKSALPWILLVIALVQFARVALPPGNADLISVQSLALDLSHHDSSLLYPGKDFSNNEQWVHHHERNLRLMNGSGEPNWCFYPPLVPWLLIPFAGADAETWRITWGVFQIGLIAALGWLIARLLATQRVAPNYVLIFALLLGSFPLARSIQLGQTSLLLAVLLWLGIYKFLRGNLWVPGLAIGFAILVKPFLALLAIIDFAKKRYRGMIGVSAVVILMLLASVLAAGFRAHVDYWYLLSTLGTSQTAYYGNQSLLGGVLRLISNMAVMDYGFQQEPLLNGLGNLLALAILITAGLAQWKAGEVSMLASVGMWISSALLALPISWEHHLVFLLPVIAYQWTRELTLRTRLVLGIATLLIQVCWVRLYSDDFVGRIAATLPMLGNLILFLLLVNLHLKSHVRGKSVILEGADVRS